MQANQNSRILIICMFHPHIEIPLRLLRCFYFNNLFMAGTCSRSARDLIGIRLGLDWDLTHWPDLLESGLGWNSTWPARKLHKTWPGPTWDPHMTWLWLAWNWTKTHPRPAWNPTETCLGLDWDLLENIFGGKHFPWKWFIRKTFSGICQVWKIKWVPDVKKYFQQKTFSDIWCVRA
jgi:hypothetical protein